MGEDALSGSRLDGIRNGIKAEIYDTPEYVEFQIAQRVQKDHIWTLEMDATQAHDPGAVLDESLEGSPAWWPGPPKGGADVLAVIPDTQQIHLRFATTPPPPKGHTLRIYPPRYLEALRDYWDNDQWAQRCLTWLRGFSQNTPLHPTRTLDPQLFPWLRDRQAAAFQLIGWERSFLWGPPGTGKTTTLGALLAHYVLSFPQARVLLLSTTNSAVDLALVAVDRALERLMPSSSTAAPARKRCCRVGNHFTASAYKGREHLLPAKDVGLIQKLTTLEARRPNKEEIHAYARWKQEVESIRTQLRQKTFGLLKIAHLAAMTTTRAVFNFADLAALAPYDLLVFDEASQVGLAHALALAPLAKSVIFAGDPKQLRPIVRSKHDLAKHWLGQSMFSEMQKSAAWTCRLNEQSRMAAPICQLVSGLFYEGELVVAQDCQHDPRWSAARALSSIPRLGDKNVSLYAIEESGTWSRKYRGPIRYQSAKGIQALVATLTEQTSPADILVLTPFRAQRALIRSFLQNPEQRQVSVSTVHRAQGKECHTVIFDPVQGENSFLQEENATQLINVALSRAQARLVIFLSPGDHNNPLLHRLATLIALLDAPSQPIPIQRLAVRPDFPDCALEHVVQIADITGKVVRVDRYAGKFVLLDVKTGKERKYVTAGIIKQFKHAALQTRAPAPQGPQRAITPFMRTEARVTASSAQRFTLPAEKDTSPQKDDFGLSIDTARLTEKAAKILGDSQAHQWTPRERREVRQQLGSEGLGDTELARQLLQALDRAQQHHKA